MKKWNPYKKKGMISGDEEKMKEKIRQLLDIWFPNQPDKYVSPAVDDIITLMSIFEKSIRREYKE